MAGDEYMPYEDRLRKLERKLGPENVTDQHKAALKIQDLAWGAWHRKSLRSSYRKPSLDSFDGKPGAFIEAQRPEVRKLLQNLKSSDISDVRPPPVYRVGSKWNLQWGMFETTPTTIWKLGK
jgi:hypothetical protein